MEEGLKTRLGTPRIKRIWPHKLWLNLFRARRMLRRVQKELNAARANHSVEVKALTERYEEYLEVERARYSSMQTEWSSRLVQMAGQYPILTTDLQGQIVDPKYRQKPDAGTPKEILSGAAMDKYDEEKNRFWAEGIALGMSPAAIAERWKEVEENVVDDLIG